MDKLRQLREFQRLALREALEPDAIRLYLLLLANCGTRGSGSIEYDTIRSALGRRMTPARLKQVCHRLSGHGLIEAAPLPCGTIAKDCSVTYRILPLAAKSRR